MRLVNVVQASPFCGKTFEDANTHLQNFLEVSSTIDPKGTSWIMSALGYSRFHCSGRPRHGFTPIRKHSQHGRPDQMHSWPSTFQWTRLMPSRTGFLEFNNSRMKPSRKFGNAFRITFIPTLWHGRMDDYSELLPWPNLASSGPRRCSSGLSSLSQCCKSEDTDRQDSLQPEWKAER